MNAVRRRRPRGDRGAQVVEFAIIVPIVLLIIAGIVQFGFVFNAQVTVTQAAREGARLAAICGSTCTTPVVTSVKNAAPGLTPQSSITVTVQYCAAAPATPCTGTAGSPAYCPAGATQATGDAQVIVSFPQPLGAPLVNFALTVNGKARMPCGG